MTDVVVRNAAALYVSALEPPVTDGWVAISEGIVEAVGSGVPPTARESIDARGCLVLPGLVCAHHHLFQGTSRGVRTTAGLMGWLATHYERWIRLDAQALRAAAELSILQLLIRGCTLVAAFEFLHPRDAEDAGIVDSVVGAANRLGIRLMYVRGTTPTLEPDIADQLSARDVDLDRLLEPKELALARIRRLVTRPATDVVRWACGPTTPVVDDEGEFQRELNTIAQECGVSVHTHFHPLTATHSGFHAAKELGLVRRGNWFAHGSRLTVRDVERLGTEGVGVVHCPSASMVLGYRIPNLSEWRRVNDRVAIGVDGAASNDRGSMIGEAQLAYYTQGLPEVLAQGREASPELCLELATASAARAIGWQGAGTLKPGSLGDVVLFDLRDVDLAGSVSTPSDALMRLFRTYQGARALDVLVGGKAVVLDGQLTTASEASIADEANLSADLLSSRVAQTH